MEPFALRDYAHAPTHLFIPGATYYITGGTLRRKRILGTRLKKTVVVALLHRWCEDIHWSLGPWVVLDNHYHFLARASERTHEDVAELIRKLHQDCSFHINGIDGVHERKVFYNYWDKCISYERSYHARVNYIHHNPVKHGYVEIAEDYIFGSYHYESRLEWREYEQEYPWDGVKVVDDF